MRAYASLAGGGAHRRNDRFSRVHSHPGPTKVAIGQSDRAIENAKETARRSNRKPRETEGRVRKTGERRVFCPLRGESKTRAENQRRVFELHSRGERSPAHLRPYPLRFAAPCRETGG